MTFDSIAQAQAILDELKEHALEGGLDPNTAVFTLDIAVGTNALDSGRAVVTVGPPSAEFITSHAMDITWKVIVAAGPHHDYLASWTNLDRVAGALLAPPTAIEQVRPIAWQPGSAARTYSAYELTITTSDSP